MRVLRRGTTGDVTSGATAGVTGLIVAVGVGDSFRSVTDGGGSGISCMTGASGPATSRDLFGIISALSIVASGLWDCWF